MRSEIAANLNVFEFVKIFGEIFKTLGVRWSNRYGVTAPLRALHFYPEYIDLPRVCTCMQKFVMIH